MRYKVMGYPRIVLKPVPMRFTASPDVAVIGWTEVESNMIKWYSIVSNDHYLVKGKSAIYCHGNYPTRHLVDMKDIIELRK